VGHVEAGLRTYDKFRPFPEEMDRRLCDTLCDYHYAPTPRARENLLKENISPEHIVVTGNTVIDALIDVANRPYQFADPLLERVGRERKLLLVTAHRRESFGEQFEHICMAVRDLVSRNLNVEVIFPVHPNTNVHKTVYQILTGVDRAHLVPPQEYQPMVNLLKKATIVLTDSGGIQEEAPSLGKRVLVMRNETERPEGIEAGAALLVGTSYAGIVERTQHILDNPEAYARMANKVNPYGDGLARKRIADHIVSVMRTG
jgi:UDP-N-acetylglucosamine 2-epimerase (non-hydrolysing)